MSDVFSSTGVVVRCRGQGISGTPRSPARTARSLRPGSGRRSPSAHRPPPVRGSGRSDHPLDVVAGNRQLRDGDVGRVTVDRRTVLVQNVDLVAHGGRVAEDVAGVGVLRDELQRLPFATASDHDRHVLLHRPRVADRFRHGDRLALEPRRPRSPHQREQLQRVLEQRVPACVRRELPAVELVFALEPRGAHTADGAPVRDSTSSVATIFPRWAMLR